MATEAQKIADAQRILMAELQKETAELARLQQGSDAAAITSKQADIASVQRELRKLGGARMNDGLLPPAGGSSSSSISSSASSRTSVPLRDRIEVPSALAATPFAPDNALGTQVDLLNQALGVTRQSADMNSAALGGARDMASQLYSNAMLTATKDRQVADSKNAILALSGMGADNPTAFATAQREIDSIDSQYEIARREYDAMASKSFIDDPLGFIDAQLNMGAAAAKVNALAAASDRAHEKFVRTSVRTEAQQRVGSANTAAIDQQIAEGTAKAALSRAQSDLAALQGQQLDRQSDNLRQLAASAGTILSGSVANVQRVAASEAVSEKANEDNELQAAVDRTNEGAATQFTVEMVKRDPKLRELVLNYGATGSMPLLQYVEIARAGAEAGKLRPEFRPMYESALQISAAVDAELRNNAVLYANDKKARETAYAKVVKELIASARGEQGTQGMLAPSYDVRPSPFKLQHQTVVQAVEKAKAAGGNLGVNPNNIVYQRMKYLVENGQVSANTGNIEGAVEGEVLKTLIEQVADGELKYQGGQVAVQPAELAQQIQEYYDGASKLQSNLLKLDKLGIPPAGAYTARIPGIDMPVDLRNKAKVELAVAKGVQRAKFPMYSPERLMQLPLNPLTMQPWLLNQKSVRNILP